MKKIILILALSLLPLSSNAFVSDDVVNIHFNLLTTSDYTITIPTGKDFVLTGVSALDEGAWDELINIYDNTTPIYRGDFLAPQDILLVIRDELVFENWNWFTIETNIRGYYIDEGDTIGGIDSIWDIWSNLISTLETFLSTEESFKIISLLSLWTMTIYLIIITIWEGFKIWFKFSKKIFLWK